MSSFEELRIEGHLGEDAKLTYTQSGKAVTKFSVAVNPHMREGEQPKPPTWFRVTVWDTLAERCKNLRKGTGVSVVGTVRASAYTDKNGQPAASLDVTARKVFISLLADEALAQTFDMNKNEDIPF